MRKEEEESPKRLGSVQPKLSSVWHTGLSGGAPDSVQCARLSPVKRPLWGKDQQRTAIIHRTVRWCTIVSAMVGRAIRERRVARTNGRQGAPDSVRCAIGPEVATVECALFGRQLRTGQL
jgi:hypothetical protein